MKIGCIGWGSLIWDPRELEIQYNWRNDGPYLPIEFARQSKDNRITLVLVRDFKPLQTLWTVLKYSSLDTAIEALRKREGIHQAQKERYIGVWIKEQKHQNDSILESVNSWAKQTDLDAVIWTNLPPKFNNIDGKVPTIEEVLQHFSNLSIEERKKAEEYVRKTPLQIQTNYRAEIETFLLSLTQNI